MKPLQFSGQIITENSTVTNRNRHIEPGMFMTYNLCYYVKGIDLILKMNNKRRKT
jgi:hypothetical protein